MTRTCSSQTVCRLYVEKERCSGIRCRVKKRMVSEQNRTTNIESVTNENNAKATNICIVYVDR
jgi:hypothetical protein